MRDTVREEIEIAANEFEATALELRPDHSQNLAEIYKEANTARYMAIVDKYIPLKIAGVTDKNGYNLVYSALQDVKAERVRVDKIRKTTNKDANEWIRTNNGEAKRLVGILAPVELHLQAERDRHESEIEAIKAEKQRIADERNQGRVNALLAVGAEVPLATVVLMDDGTFTSYLSLATKAFHDTVAQVAAEAAAEQARLDAEAAEKARKEQEEADRLAKVRAEQAAEQKRLDAIAAEQAKQAAGLKAQQDAIDKQKADMERTAREDQIRKDTEARVKVEAEEKAERKAVEDAERLEKVNAKAAEIQAAKPDAEKLHAMAVSLANSEWPHMTTAAGHRIMTEAKASLARLTFWIESKADDLTK